MRLLLDANLSPRIAVRLRSASVEVTHVCDHGLTAATDGAVLRHAIESDATIVSADSDFATLLALGGLRGPSLILLRSSDHLTPDEQADLLLANLPAVVDDQSRIGCLAQPHSSARTAVADALSRVSDWRVADLAARLPGAE